MNAVLEKTRKVVTNGTTRRIPENEPVFLLRGQDQFAASVVRHWAGLVEAGGGDPEIVRTALEHANKMDAWPTKKVPDLPKALPNFVTVPETTLPNGTVVPAFEVSRFLCTVEDGGATIQADTVPTVEISYYDAIKACEAVGLNLIRETQALALAWNIYNVDANWTSGKVGEGDLRQGLRNGTVDEAQPNDFVPEDQDEDRRFWLSTGEPVYDVTGHLYTWVFDDVQGDDQGLVARKFTADSISISTSPFPSRKRGAGWQPSLPCNWSGYALIRGGGWSDGGYAGVFRLNGTHPFHRGDYVGFRSTK